MERAHQAGTKQDVTQGRSDRIKSLLTAPLLFDGRNLYSPAAMGSRGFAYFCIGRRPD